MASAAKRRAQAAAGRERRKKIFVIVGICIFVILLAIQLPKTLDLLSSDTVAVAPVTAPPAPPAAPVPAATETQTAPSTLRLLQGPRSEERRVG